jgi:beta-lactamase class A
MNSILPRIDSAIAQLDQMGVKYAFYFHRPSVGEPILRANWERFSSASIIKVPILLAWVLLERRGEVDRTEICDLDAEPQIQGAGFAWMMHARRIPYADVLLLMISLSDNLCTNLIIRRIGLARLQQVMRDELGLQGTEVQRKLMDYEARSRGLDNWVTSRDAIHFYDIISSLEPDERAWVDSLLLANEDSALLKRNIPRDTLEFFHKTGSVEQVLHDWGYTRDCRIFLFTNAVPSEPPVFEVFGKLGELMISG